MKTSFYHCIFFVLLSLVLISNLSAGEQLNPGDIIAKNIEAAGGKDLINSISGVSFETQDDGYRRVVTTYYVSKDGKMKIVTGKAPLIEEVVVVENDSALIKSFQNRTLTSIKVDELKVLAKLIGGGFTLNNFKKGLSLSGIKKYGPEKLFVLTSKIGEHDIAFYIDTVSFVLKRMVLSGNSKEQGRYESVYEFGPSSGDSGLKIPAFWFKSFIGSKKRNQSTVNLKNLKNNITIEKGFFKKMAINMGTAVVKEGFLEGNIIAPIITPSRNVLFCINWSAADSKKAGFKKRDKLKLKIGEDEIDAVFLESSSDFTDEDATPANKNVFLMELETGNLLYIVMFSEAHKPFYEKYKSLTTVSAKKIVSK
ncbi:MAG: hypothetical protein GY757_12055 [bacterium]|nr:hypothetical protein [bacterium]